MLPRSPWSPRSVALVAAMAVGSAMMWIGLPLGLVWVASVLSTSSRPTLGPYLLVMIGLPAGMLVIGRALGALDRAHAAHTGAARDQPLRAAWLKSMRDDRERRRRGSVLETVMAVSVTICLLVLLVWFLAFAGSPLPA